MEGIVLGRRGHYFTPNGGEDGAFGGSCQLADVVDVVTTNGPLGTYVNLTGWQHDGDSFTHEGVPVVGSIDGIEPDLPGRMTEVGGASWHLTRACPFGR